MPKFYLDLNECGLTTVDENGFEYPDMAAARANALAAARSIMAAEVQEGRLCLECRVELRDAERRLVMTLPFRSAIKLSGSTSDDQEVSTHADTMLQLGLQAPRQILG